MVIQALPWQLESPHIGPQSRYPTSLSPRRAPQATHFMLFPRHDTPEAPLELPPSTAPPRLEQLEEEAQGRGKKAQGREKAV